MSTFEEEAIKNIPITSSDSVDGQDFVQGTDIG